MGEIDWGVLTCVYVCLYACPGAYLVWLTLNHIPGTHLRLFFSRYYSNLTIPFPYYFYFMMFLFVLLFYYYFSIFIKGECVIIFIIIDLTRWKILLFLSEFGGLMQLLVPNFSQIISRKSRYLPLFLPHGFAVTCRWTAVRQLMGRLFRDCFVIFIFPGLGGE